MFYLLLVKNFLEVCSSSHGVPCNIFHVVIEFIGFCYYIPLCFNYLTWSQSTPMGSLETQVTLMVYQLGGNI